jgi:hypothetical protein
MPAPTTVAVVGSGLAGLAAAYELSVALQARLPEAQMVLFEKNAAVGGNSAKASSGINAINMEQGDTPAAFAADTLQSGGGLSAQELVHTLVVSGGWRAASCGCAGSSNISAQFFSVSSRGSPTAPQGTLLALRRPPSPVSPPPTHPPRSTAWRDLRFCRPWVPTSAQLCAWAATPTHAHTAIRAVRRRQGAHGACC